MYLPPLPPPLKPPDTFPVHENPLIPSPHWQDFWETLSLGILSSIAVPNGAFNVFNFSPQLTVCYHKKFFPKLYSYACHCCFSKNFPLPHPPSQPPDPLPIHKTQPTSSPHWQQVWVLFSQNSVQCHLYGDVVKRNWYKSVKKKEDMNESYMNFESVVQVKACPIGYFLQGKPTVRFMMGNKLANEEFMILHVGAHSFKEAWKIAAETHYYLKAVMKKRYGQVATNVGDEGDLAPTIQGKGLAIAKYSYMGEFITGEKLASVSCQKKSAAMLLRILGVAEQAIRLLFGGYIILLIYSLKIIVGFLKPLPFRVQWIIAWSIKKWELKNYSLLLFEVEIVAGFTWAVLLTYQFPIRSLRTRIILSGRYCHVPANSRKKKIEVAVSKRTVTGLNKL